MAAALIRALELEVRGGQDAAKRVQGPVRHVTKVDGAPAIHCD